MSQLVEETGLRIAQLESKLAEIQAALESERLRHREESLAQDAKLRALEAQLVAGTSADVPSVPHSKGSVGGQAKRRSLKAQTVPQRGWEEFCVVARNEFTAAELASVSRETLLSLMQHYAIRSPAQRMDIERQWAAFQKEKKVVSEEKLAHRISTSTSRSPIRRAQHPTPFDPRGEPLKPHLSKRSLIKCEGIKPSNPNESTSGSNLVRQHAAVVIPAKYVDPCPSNPNETVSRSGQQRFCLRRTASPGQSPTPTSGKRQFPTTISEEYKVRGRRPDPTKDASHAAEDMPKRPSSIRCVTPPGQVHHAKARGIRVFERPPSPTLSSRPSIHVATPPHLDRVHLLTLTVGASRSDHSLKSQRPMTTLELRTPFALGDN